MTLKDFIDPIQSALITRGALVRRMRNDVRIALARYRAARKSMSLDTRASLRKRRAEIAASVGNIRYERRLMVDRMARSGSGTKDDLSVELALPEQINTNPAHENLPNTVERSVLQTIRAHPEGLTMQEIGNAMGVDWRSLLQAAHFLAEAGVVERIEELIYPVLK